MAKINLKDICTSYYDIDGNLIAVATQEISRDGSKKFKLYRTDAKMTDFELTSSASSPILFDAILYPNHVVSASVPKSKPVRTKIDLSKLESLKLSKSGTSSTTTKAKIKSTSINTKRKKLF